MNFFTETQHAQLLANGTANAEAHGDLDFPPVVKLFTPDANCTWLLSEIDPENQHLAFGLCDLGMGFPELGYVDLGELATVRGRFGLCVERDLSFAASHPLSVYARAAHDADAITEDCQALDYAAAALALEPCCEGD